MVPRFTEPVPANDEGQVPAELARLTRREREVLHPLVVGISWAHGSGGGPARSCCAHGRAQPPLSLTRSQRRDDAWCA